jgi:hypothetical protein
VPSRRALVYLLLVGPLHHLALVIATLIPTLLFPPDLWLQLILAVPIFCLAISWAVPAFMRWQGLIPIQAATTRIRAVVVLMALFLVSTIFLSVIIGLMSLIEATVFYLIAVAFSHIAVLRWLT